MYSLVAMFIDISSWNSNFAAYGMWICEILVLFLHGRHSNEFFFRFLYSEISVKSLVGKRGQRSEYVRDRCHQPTDIADVNAEGV